MEGWIARATKATHPQKRQKPQKPQSQAGKPNKNTQNKTSPQENLHIGPELFFFDLCPVLGLFPLTIYDSQNMGSVAMCRLSQNLEASTSTAMKPITEIWPFFTSTFDKLRLDRGPET